MASTVTRRWKTIIMVLGLNLCNLAGGKMDWGTWMGLSSADEASILTSIPLP